MKDKFGSRNILSITYCNGEQSFNNRIINYTLQWFYEKSEIQQGVFFRPRMY